MSRAIAADWIEFLQRIVRARDYNAEHGVYPPEYGIECFDDWAADIAATLLELNGTQELPIGPKVQA
jgi:hypothetical protein